MIKKICKEVDIEVVILKNDLNLKSDDLSEKFVNLEKRHDKCNVVNSSQCSMFNCGECGEEFENRTQESS